jgi:hypothetical protein
MFILTSAFSGVLGLIFMALWLSLAVITILSILRNQGHTLSTGNKLLWIIIIMVIPIIGPLTYLIWKSAKKPEA